MSQINQNTPPEKLEQREGKYLIFALAGEEYGIAIQRVKEIIGIINITPIPQTPAFVKGVINLRGKVIPVMDLRLKFEMNGAEFTERTCIIVIELNKELDNVQVGVVVDAVSEVQNIRETEIENAPALGSNVNTDFIMGMAKTENRIRLLLDIDRVMNDGGLSLLSKAA